MDQKSGVMSLTPEDAAATGMIVALHARSAPERTAIISDRGDRTFAELNGRANQLVCALRARGLQAGDAVALLCSNRPEFAEAMAAAQRGGFRITPINWHLTGPEIGYILDNCEAKAFLAEDRFATAAAQALHEAPAAKVKLGIGGAFGPFKDYDTALDAESTADIDNPILGSQMLYTSGTTGRPKGVYRDRPPPQSPLVVALQQSAAFDPYRDIALCTGPLYHAAPLALNLSFPINAGIGVVLMDKWDAEETLRLVERYGVTHSHLVPTMFHRLLKLPEETKRRYDLATFRWILHGAAPCPAHVKKAMIDWLGPVLVEYYAATEGGGFLVHSEEWLKRPGSVGRALPGVECRIFDDNGTEVPPGETGTVYFKAPEFGRFSYFKDEEKTAKSYRGDYYTMGDHGYLDDEGYLYLTGRSAELIIAGGVNIYPAEVDEVLLAHPAVHDACTVGVPNEEWGEEVKAVVELRDNNEASEALAAELIAHCRENLAAYKVPRSVDFTHDLPRLDSGKIQRRSVRDRYWAGRDRSI